MKFHAFDPTAAWRVIRRRSWSQLDRQILTITVVPNHNSPYPKTNPQIFVFQVRPIGTFSGSVQVSILPPNTGTAWPAGTYAPSSGSFNGAFGDLSAGEHHDYSGKVRIGLKSAQSLVVSRTKLILWS